MEFGGTKSGADEDPIRKRMAIVEERFEDVRRIEKLLSFFMEKTWGIAVSKKLLGVAKAYRKTVESSVAASARKDIAKLNASADIALFERADMHRRHLEMSLYVARQGLDAAMALLNAEQTLCRTRKAEGAVGGTEDLDGLGWDQVERRTS